MEAAKAHGTPLPHEAFALRVRDELADYLHVPDDGSRVEIVGGEIVVSGSSARPSRCPIRTTWTSKPTTGSPGSREHQTDAALSPWRRPFVVPRVRYPCNRFAANSRRSPDLIFALPVSSISSSRKNSTWRGTL